MGNLVNLCRAGDRALQLLLFNEEFLVSVSHQLALITSLPFVHTARRYYRLNGLVRPPDRLCARPGALSQSISPPLCITAWALSFWFILKRGRLRFYTDHPHV